MLWRSTEFNNINGGVAGLMLFAYYNGLLGFSDILPNDEDIVERGAIVGYPKERCAALLAKMRTLFPDSGLWRLEEARTLGNHKDLRGAIHVLRTNAASKMRQVTALNSFELSLASMYVQDYPQMRDSFLRCLELNDWSHALYYYLAGCAELENYRNAFHATTATTEEGKGKGGERDESAVRTHKKRAEELFRKAPSVVGKKKLLARPMPFELFVARKLSKWEERAKALGVDLADAAGVSPAQEMTYLWNGTKKMTGADLEGSRAALSWDRLTAPTEKARLAIRAEKDEEAVRDVCMAAVLRNLGRYDEARAILGGLMAVDRYVHVLRIPFSPSHFFFFSFTLELESYGWLVSWLTRSFPMHAGPSSRAPPETITRPPPRTTRWRSWRGSMSRNPSCRLTRPRGHPLPRPRRIAVVVAVRARL